MIPKVKRLDGMALPEGYFTSVACALAWSELRRHILIISLLIIPPLWAWTSSKESKCHGILMILL
jgi:hypothetical protein